MCGRSLLIIAGLAGFVIPCPAQIVDQPGLPFRIEDADLDLSATTKEACLRFTLENATGSPMQKISIGILVKNSAGLPRGFQITPLTDLNIAAGGKAAVSLRLSNLMYIDERPVNFAAAITQVRTEANAWRQALSPVQFALALNEGNAIPVVPLPAGLAEQGCDVTWCLECRQTVQCLCGLGTACVVNYKCTRGPTCECSFTCSGNPSCERKCM